MCIFQHEASEVEMWDLKYMYLFSWLYALTEYMLFHANKNFKWVSIPLNPEVRKSDLTSLGRLTAWFLDGIFIYQYCFFFSFWCTLQLFRHTSHIMAYNPKSIENVELTSPWKFFSTQFLALNIFCCFWQKVLCFRKRFRLERIAIKHFSFSCLYIFSCFKAHNRLVISKAIRTWRY